ncbi:MAG: hypothetical protein ABL918_03625 [Chakrabartia sp.]
MGKPDWLDRFAQILIALGAVVALLNGGFMLWDPYGWYQAVPTVKFTGPPNQHFMRDIGIAFLTSGGMAAYAAFNPSGRWLAAFAGSMFLAGHGALHVWEVMTGICATNIFWRDAPGVLGMPLLVWTGLGILFARQRIVPAGLPVSVVIGVIDKVSPGETAYFREIAKAPGHAFEKLQHFMPITMHRYAAPADLFAMARIGATLVEDCGPCALTAAQGAIADGVPRDVINLALSSTPPDGDLKIAFNFGQAIANHSPDAMTLGDMIEQKYCRNTRLELAMTAATVRAYPAMKRGLGLGQSCALTPLKV